MILLTVEEVIALHQKLIDRTGGSHGLRDQSLLESAVYSAMSGFEGSEAYPTIEEKAARLMYSLTNNHAFVDGNKRIGVFVMLMTLQLNKVKIDYTQAELISLSLSVASGKTEYEKILDWIIKHKI
jgi:death-on-curing protein